MNQPYPPSPAADSGPYDLLVMGSGPAGIAAAMQACKLNKKVAIIEAHPDNLGGSWLHTGTIPSKTLREVLAAIQNIKYHVGHHWVDRIVNNLSSNLLIKRARKVSGDEEDHVRKFLKRNEIEVISGYGRIETTNSVRVTPRDHAPFILETEKIMIATGSRPRRPADIPFDDWRVVDSDGILQLEALPSSVLVFGAGVIGCEYACIFSALGVKTTIVDARQRIMQFVDREVADELKSSMESLGVEFRLGYHLDQLEVTGPGVICHAGDTKIESDIFFFAAGRESCTRDLGLNRVGIETSNRGAIQVNEFFQTSVPSIYAAGDVIGPPALASTSREQGRLAMQHAFDGSLRTFPKFFPVGVYTIPEMSSVGQSEEELKKEGIDYVVGRANYDELARGYIRGDHHGLLKIIVEKSSHKVLGVHVIGADAANLVHIGQAWMMADVRLDEALNGTVFNYPTLAEAYQIAAFNALNKILEAEKKDSTLKAG